MVSVFFVSGKYRHLLVGSIEKVESFSESVRDVGIKRSLCGEIDKPAASDGCMYLSWCSFSRLFRMLGLPCE